MPLILAIDPDKRQSTQLATLVTTELEAELVQRATAAEAAEPLAAEFAAGPPPASELDNLSIDPVAAQALEELSRQLPAASLADAIPAEAPVPVVEMQTFETLDAIASQLAAVPLPKHENLDDLASLFAATPTPPHAAPLTSGFDTPSPGRHEFEALFAAPSAEAAAPIEVPGIDPSLFASPAAQPPSAAAVLVDSVPESREQEAAVDRSWAPAAPEPSFSFTFVDGFGDTWSDFDVPSVAAVAADLGLPPSGPMDTEPAATAPEAAAAPVLDDEALSLIGDAAHRASLDALVIEEFERGLLRGARKAKPTAHAGATQVTPAVTTPAAKKKAPVQDEWGLFDPEQCGFAALEEEDPAERRKTRDGTRVRVISY